jgi:hypothetical protein
MDLAGYLLFLLNGIIMTLHVNVNLAIGLKIVNALPDVNIPIGAIGEVMILEIHAFCMVTARLAHGRGMNKA